MQPNLRCIKGQNKVLEIYRYQYKLANLYNSILQTYKYQFCNAYLRLSFSCNTSFFSFLLQWIKLQDHGQLALQSPTSLHTTTFWWNYSSEVQGGLSFSFKMQMHIVHIFTNALLSFSYCSSRIFVLYIGFLTRQPH